MIVVILLLSINNLLCQINLLSFSCLFGGIELEGLSSLCFVRDTLNMNPPTGSKGHKVRKRGVAVCSRVMMLIKKLKAYQQKLGEYFQR